MNLKQCLIIIIGVLMAFCASAQVPTVSPNGEYSFRFIEEYQVVTGQGDTINVGHEAPDGITNEGHLYFDKSFEGVMLKVYIADPWICDNCVFLQFSDRGNVLQSMMVFVRTLDKYVAYQSRLNGEVVIIVTDRKYLKLWDYGAN
jgi:hypothetical protein